jgi:hypothetical protein
MGTNSPKTSVLKPLIYLSGPISGTEPEDQQWRSTAKAALIPFYDVIDPLDRKYTADNIVQIVRGDLVDVARCDYLLVNAVRPSWGTAMEVFFASSLGVLVIVVIDKQISPWLIYHSTNMFKNVESALEYLVALEKHNIRPSPI